jgi:hypothetical protein
MKTIILLLLFTATAHAQTRVTTNELSTTAAFNFPATAPMTVSSLTVTNITLPTRDKIKSGNVVNQSTSSIALSSITITATTQGQCVTGSTVTLTTYGGDVEITFMGTCYGNLSNQCYISIYGDGAPTFIGAIGNANIPVANYSTMVGMDYILSIAAGSHTFCLQSWADGAGITLNKYGKSSFRVKELR